MPEAPLKVFISYSHNEEDAKVLRKLRKHLTPREKGVPPLFEIWDDTHLKAGDDYDNAIRQFLNAADIVLLLVSDDFNASDYITRVEITNAMARHAAGTCKVVPIYINYCDFEEMPYAQFEMLPKHPGDNRLEPVLGKWHNQDLALLTVVKGLLKLAEEMISPNASTDTAPVGANDDIVPQQPANEPLGSEMDQREALSVKAKEVAEQAKELNRSIIGNGAPPTVSNDNYYNRSRGTKPIFPKAAITVNRVEQKYKFDKSVESFRFPKLHLFFVHGDNKQELQKMIERFAWEEGVVPQFNEEQVAGDSSVIEIVSNANTSDMFLHFGIRDLLSKLQPEIKTTTSLASVYINQGTSKREKSKFIFFNIARRSWNETWTPEAIQNFVEQFLLREPMPDNAPDFYFFFGIEYEKPSPPSLLNLFKRLFALGGQNHDTKTTVEASVTNAMDKHKAVTLLPKLQPPSIDDLEVWFTKNRNIIPSGESVLDFTQKFIRRNGLRSDYNDMKVLMEKLTELIDQYNEGKPL